MLESVENSITFHISDNTRSIINGYNYARNDLDNHSYILPIIGNLRLRSDQSLTGEVLGYMNTTKPSQVVLIGDTEIIDGREGNWLRIRPFLSNTLYWVFGGYTRAATEERDWDFLP